LKINEGRRNFDIGEKEGKGAKLIKKGGGHARGYGETKELKNLMKSANFCK